MLRSGDCEAGIQLCMVLHIYMLHGLEGKSGHDKEKVEHTVMAEKESMRLPAGSKGRQGTV